MDSIPEWFRDHQELYYCLASHCSCSPSFGTGAEVAVADIAGVEIAVANIVAGAGVEVAAADITANDVDIAVPTLFTFADTSCCNNYNALG